MNNSCRKIICVTGKMASGKNTVCSILEQYGFICLDADKVVHKAIEKATPKILDTFNELATSKGIILTNKDGSLNRKALAELIFEDKNLLKQQEEIIYPFVTEETQNFINNNANKNIILNATVLYKIPQLMEQCDYIFFVKSSTLQRFFRVCKRDKIKIKNIIQRFRSQKTLFQEYEATNIPIIKIQNKSNISKLTKHIHKALNKIK